MSKSPAVRLSAGVAAAMLATSATLALGATAASAASSTHVVKYSCKVPVVGTQSVTGRITLSAPAKTTAGKTVKVSVQIQPTGLPAISVTNLTVKSTLRESGAQKGSVTVTQFLKSANSGHLKLSLSGQVKLTKAGTVRLTAGSTATFSLTSSLIGKATVTCTAKSSLPVLGSIAVGKAPKHAAARLS